MKIANMLKFFSSCSGLSARQVSVAGSAVCADNGTYEEMEPRTLTQIPKEWQIEFCIYIATASPPVIK